MLDGTKGLGLGAAQVVLSLTAGGHLRWPYVQREPAALRPIAPKKIRLELPQHPLVAGLCSEPA